MATLITGGTGFIGSYLAKSLIDQGDRPVLFDISPPGVILDSVAGKFDFVRGSQDNLSIVLNCIADHDIQRIFHLGGMLSVPSEENPWAAFNANVLGTYNILEASRIRGVKQVIYGSTVATYSKDIPTPFIDDATIQRPTSMYGTTKVCGELFGRYYSHRFGIDFRGVRIPSVVGPGAKTAHMSIYNAWAIERPLQGQPYTLMCDPETRCPVMYFKDVVRALGLLATADEAGLPTRIYNLAGIAPAFSARELVDEIQRQIPAANLEFNPDPRIVSLLKELGSLAINDDCARNEWGWEIAYPLSEMVTDFIQEFNSHRGWYL
ncbi:MAG: NAD-dependent epimerase/dehydratase family protein [Desulfobacterales bacterium]|nr:NAD-dependent epimerase/dehydratase family protein [Desulfobacterales bacterium]